MSNVRYNSEEQYSGNEVRRVFHYASLNNVCIGRIIEDKRNNTFLALSVFNQEAFNNEYKTLRGAKTGLRKLVLKTVNTLLEG